MIGTAALVIGGLAALRRSVLADPLPPDDEIIATPQCRIAIVLVAADSSVVSRVVDRVTGGLGWSHVLIDPCASSRGRDIVDFTVARGVHWGSSRTYAGRTTARVELDDDDATRLWGCVRSRIGRPFRIAPLALGYPSAANCVGLAVSCAPASWRTRLDRHRRGPCYSANTIAAAFGVGRPNQPPEQRQGSWASR